MSITDCGQSNGSAASTPATPSLAVLWDGSDCELAQRAGKVIYRILGKSGYVLHHPAVLQKVFFHLYY